MRGRPVKKNSRRHRIEIRVSEEDLAILDEIQAKTGMTVSNIFRAALRLYHAMRLK